MASLRTLLLAVLVASGSLLSLAAAASPVEAAAPASLVARGLPSFAETGRPTAPIGATPRQLPPCGWFWDVSAQTLNVAGPDTHTNYWVQPYIFGPQSSIVIRGYYPFARYFSFVAYTSDGLPINNVSLHDTQLVPDPGSVNPFTTVNPPTDLNQLRYTARVVPSAPPPTATNTLVGLPTGQTSGLGWLVYRLYLPNNSNDPKAGVPLPDLTIDGVPVRTCTDAEQHVFDTALAPVANALVAFSSPDPATVTLGPNLFRRAPSLAGLFPNPDNQYVIIANGWVPGRVVVVRGKGFTFPDTQHGGSVTTPTQLRYWSWCSNELVNPYPAVQCANDADVPLDAQGNYTVAISMPQDRPANATAANGVTWLAWQISPSTTQVVTNSLYLRTMLPAAGFTQATQGVPDPAPGSTAQQLAAQAAAAMGPYYPVGVNCTRAQFEAGGPLSCFQSAGTPTASPVVPELPPLVLFGSGLLLLAALARRGRRGR